GSSVEVAAWCFTQNWGAGDYRSPVTHASVAARPVPVIVLSRSSSMPKRHLSPLVLAIVLALSLPVVAAPFGAPAMSQDPVQDAVGQDTATRPSDPPVEISPVQTTPAEDQPSAAASGQADSSDSKVPLD